MNATIVREKVISSYFLVAQKPAPAAEEAEKNKIIKEKRVKAYDIDEPLLIKYTSNDAS